MKKTMQSLLLITNDIHLGGGGERVAVNIANHYHNKGWQVELLSFRDKKERKCFDLSEHIKIIYLNTSKNKFVQKFQALNRLKLFLKNNRYRYVVGVGSYPSTILGFCGRPESVDYIGTEHSHFYHAPQIWNYLRRLAYKRLSALTVLTTDDWPIVNNINKRTVVIPNALSSFPDRYASMNNKRLLAVGRMDKFKQFDKLIDVFKDFCGKRKEWKLTIIGEGEMKDYLKSKISLYNLGDKIELKPYNPNIEYEYLNSSILLSTSKKEGLPMVMIEAQSYGLPIISYDCKTGPKDIVQNNINGYLVNLNEKKSMVNALVKLTGDDELRKEMSENAKRDALRFSPEQIYSKWDALFESLNH